MSWLQRTSITFTEVLVQFSTKIILQKLVSLLVYRTRQYQPAINYRSVFVFVFCIQSFYHFNSIKHFKVSSVRMTRLSGEPLYLLKGHFFHDVMNWLHLCSAVTTRWINPTTPIFNAAHHPCSVSNLLMLNQSLLGSSSWQFYL